jgi:hypothetical protein
LGELVLHDLANMIWRTSCSAGAAGAFAKVAVFAAANPEYSEIGEKPALGRQMLREQFLAGLVFDERINPMYPRFHRIASLAVR